MKKDKTILFPECWEEVLPAEWTYLLKLREKLINTPGIALADVKREWCRFVLHNRGMRAKNRQEYYLLIYNLALTLDWMWHESEDGQSVELIYDTTQNLLPAWRNLRGPLDHGNSLTFAEFRTCVNVMNTYTTTQAAEHLQALCGILYRKPREGFDAGRIGLYANRVRMMPAYLQWGVYAWFAYFCQFLMTDTFVIDGVEISFAPLFKRDDKEGARADEQSLGMNGILFSVAESGIFGNVHGTDETLLLRVMMKLLDDYQRAKAMSPKQSMI